MAATSIISHQHGHLGELSNGAGLGFGGGQALGGQTLGGGPGQLSAGGGATRPYRPAPAKTFQCRGYGECRMVFSRSEHLARHIRKHTGERPFHCHCGKQFSRLDNLRQHAQTVHADKPELNERMMRDLTSLHATMAAANKPGTVRGSGARRGTGASSGRTAGDSPVEEDLIKIEELPLAIHQRPDTSTGYEVEHTYSQAWQDEGDIGGGGGGGNHSFRDSQSFREPSNNHNSGNNHSFREPSQSFREPPHSFLGFSTSNSNNNFGATSAFTASGSRPNTAGGGQSLPPLSSVFPSTFPSLQQQQQQQEQSSQQRVLPLPSFGFSRLRRASNAGASRPRPGTAPALSGGWSAGMAASTAGSTAAEADVDEFDTDSPFSFHPPPAATTTTTEQQSLSAYSRGNPRKRSRGDVDGHAYDYDYGSDSRPQSRRLSVLELCNPGPDDVGGDGDAIGVLLASNEFRSNEFRSSISSRPSTSRPSTSRPNTSAALAAGTSALAISDSDGAIGVRTAATAGDATTAGGGLSSARLRGVSKEASPSATYGSGPGSARSGSAGPGSAGSPFAWSPGASPSPSPTTTASSPFGEREREREAAGLLYYRTIAAPRASERDWDARYGSRRFSGGHGHGHHGSVSPVSAGRGL